MDLAVCSALPLMEVSKGAVSDGVLALLTLPERIPSLMKPVLCPITAIPAPPLDRSWFQRVLFRLRAARSALSDSGRSSSPMWRPSPRQE